MSKSLTLYQTRKPSSQLKVAAPTSGTRISVRGGAHSHVMSEVLSIIRWAHLQAQSQP